MAFVVIYFNLIKLSKLPSYTYDLRSNTNEICNIYLVIFDYGFPYSLSASDVLISAFSALLSFFQFISTNTVSTIFRPDLYYF